MEQILILSAATASIAFTLTKTPVFNFVRDWVDRWDALAYLWTCPYCMSHWIAMAFVAVYQPRPLTGHWIDLFASVFLIVTISTYMWQVILFFGKVGTWFDDRHDKALREDGEA